MTAADDTQQLAELVEPFRSRIARLLEAGAGAFWIGSGRRSIQQQIALRREHCGTTYYDIWQRPSRECNPPTARPGHSKHETGEAADLEGNLALAESLAGRYGLGTPVEGEAWHFEATGAAMQGLTGASLPGVGDVLTDPAGAVVSVMESLTDPFLAGAQRIALVGLILAGGVGLVVMGGIRSGQELRR